MPRSRARESELGSTGRDYQMFLRADGLLVGIAETADLAAVQPAMDAPEVSARWESEMAPFFDLPDGRIGRDKYELALVFDLETQLASVEVERPAANGDTFGRS